MIWAAEVAASPAADWLAVAGDRCGRVLVGSDLRPPGMDDVFDIGDTALARDVASEPLPGIAPVAKQQGAYVAEAITLEPDRLAVVTTNLARRTDKERLE